MALLSQRDGQTARPGPSGEAGLHGAVVSVESAGAVTSASAELTPTYQQEALRAGELLCRTRCDSFAALGRIEISGGSLKGGSVTRADVAAVAAGVLHLSSASRRTIDFNNGPTPIGEALDAL